MVKIYTLSNPLTNEIRYIGKTSQKLEKRLDNHLYNKSKTYCKSWIQSLINNNLKPKIELLEEVEDSMWEISEIYWIAQFKQWGFNLTNILEGGKNTKYKYNIDKISKPKERKKRSIESYKKSGETNRGKKRTQLQIERIRDGKIKFYKEKKEKGIGLSEKQLIHLKNLIENNKHRPLNNKVIEKLHEGRDLYFKNRIKIIKEPKRKKCALIDDDGNILEIFNNVREAAIKLELNESSISKVCNGQRNQVYNKKFIHI